MSRLKTIIDANIKENGNQEITGKTMNYVLNEIANDINTDGYFPNMSVGFADNLVGRGESVPAEFTFRATGGKSIKDGAARIKRIKGNSVVWNQKARQEAESSSAGGLTANWEGNKIHIQGVVNRDGDINIYAILNSPTTIEGHKYLARIEGSELIDFFAYGSIVNADIYHQAILDATNGEAIFTLRPSDGAMNGQTIDVYISFQFSDLTQMFQAGNEPTAIEEYNARKPIVADEYAYNEGEVIHMNTENIKSVGDNAWDEEWENGIIINGENVETEVNIRSKNYIPIIGGEDYHYANKEWNYDDYISIFFYDENKNLIDTLAWSIGTFPTPANARYMRFYINDSYGGVYNHDIILTLAHSGWKSDPFAPYQPYWQDALPLPIIRKYFPQGMKSAGNACDVIDCDCKKKQAITNVGVASNLSFSQMQEGVFYVDLPNMKLPTSTMERMKGIFTNRYAVETDAPSIGNMADKSIIRFADGNIYIKDMSYTNADEFNAANTDLVVCYELAEPIVTEITEPFGTDYRVADFGTEQAQSSVPSAAFRADIIYQFNAVDMIRELWLKVQELESRVAQL